MASPAPPENRGLRHAEIAMLCILFLPVQVLIAVASKIPAPLEKAFDNILDKRKSQPLSAAVTEYSNNDDSITAEKRDPNTPVIAEYVEDWPLESE